jgi:hypothetical protein
MNKVSFEIPRYEREFVRFVDQVINGFVSLDPLLGSIQRSSTVHRGPVRNVQGDNLLDQQAFAIQSEANLDVEVIRKTDVDGHTAFMYMLAESIVRSFGKKIFKGLDEIVDATGNSIDTKGERFSFDMFLDALEKMHIGFDDEGQPIMPTIVVPLSVVNQVAETKPTSEQEKRQAEILTRKKEEYDAQKRTRKLSH